MKLKEYLDLSDFSPKEIAAQWKIPYCTLLAYARGDHFPGQKRAEEIERMTKRQITVRELRGKDERFRR